ncbi:CU044_5270 family protein [Actinoplanes subglobosus]|uniref:CU044_5270 family protein n=1 Tax=Actinoplanes subglobosus TaxID=1547892 RepID=A0ABV8INW9_9ACTN
MDELDLLATARPATPPSAETTAAARDRLYDLMNATKPAPAAPRRRFRLLGWGLAVPAMAAAVALLMVLTSVWVRPGEPDRGTVDIADAGPRPPQELRNLLLAAAQHTATDPATTGRYWVSEIESGTLIQVGPAGNRYAIMGRTNETTWYTVRRDDRAVHLQQWAGAAPASDADRAAWQRAGKPSTWLIDEACPTSGNYTAGPGATRTIVGEPEPSTFLIGGGYISAEQVGDLPSEPARLQEWLIDRLRVGSPGLTAAELSKGVFDSIINLLYQAPSTPEVRAAAYRVLADLPGLRDLGTVTDPKGRSGNAVTLVTNDDTPGVRQADTGGAQEVRLIFDPKSGQPLAWETRVLNPVDYLSWVPAGALFDYKAVVRTRWTDDPAPDTTGALPETVQEPATC